LYRPDRYEAHTAVEIGGLRRRRRRMEIRT
jgi:hypothetical protein